MTRPIEQLIETLAAEARPVTPLAAPSRRALATLAALAAAGALAILFLSSPQTMRSPGAEGSAMMAAELLAMLATGIVATIAAFHLAIPGRSRRWLLAPLPPLALWLLLSGAGCYADLVRNGPGGWEIGHSGDCLLIILGTSAVVAPPLIWRLSRAAPIDPLPVALLGGLGTAALAAFLLQFFHPFTVTFLDLGVHTAAVLIVVAIVALLRRPALARA